MLLYFHLKNNCLDRFEPTTGSQQRPFCAREPRLRGEGEREGRRERERATKRASISGDGGDPAAVRAAAPQQQRQASMVHYGCHVDAPRLRRHAGKQRVLFSAYLGFLSPLGVSLSLSLQNQQQDQGNSRVALALQ